jgi:hypothetical protein
MFISPGKKCIPVLYRAQEMDSMLAHKPLFTQFRLVHHVSQIFPSTIKGEHSLEGIDLDILHKDLWFNRKESYLQHISHTLSSG